MLPGSLRTTVIVVIILSHDVLPGSLRTTVIIVICHIMLYLGLSIPPSLLSSATLCITWVSPYHRHCCHLPHYVLPGSLHTTVIVVICHIMYYLGLSIPPSLLSSATLCVTWVSAFHRPCCHLPHYVLPGSLHTTVLVVICHIMYYLGLCIPPSLLSSATLCVTWVSAYRRHCCHLPHYVLPGSLHTAVIVVICHIMCYLGLCIPPSLLSSATLCFIWVSAYHRYYSATLCVVCVFPYNRSFHFIQSLVVPGKGGGGGDAASDNFLLLGLLLAFCSCEHWHFWIGPVFDVLYPPCPSLSASASSLFGVPCRVVFDRVSCSVVFDRVSCRVVFDRVSAGWCLTGCAAGWCLGKPV